MVDVIPETVRKCSGILKAAKSDTEKFTALFMATKLMKSKECQLTAKKALLDAIGIEYLKKLLLGKDLSDDCPPAMYRSVALSILNSCCKEPELAIRADILSLVPMFLEILDNAEIDDCDDNLISCSETYNCLKLLAQHKEGKTVLMDNNCIAKMSYIYSFRSFQADDALHLIELLIGELEKDSRLIYDTEPLHCLIERISYVIKTENGNARKYEMCTILASILVSCDEKWFSNSLNTKSWPKYLFEGCSSILCGDEQNNSNRRENLITGLNAKERESIVQLLASILTVLGVSWTFMEKTNGLYLSVLQMAATEVRFQMDDKRMEKMFANSGILQNCFVILHKCMDYLSDEPEFHANEKQTIFTALNGAFNKVFAVLNRIANDKIKDTADPKQRRFIADAVGIWTVWLTLEPSTLQPAAYKLIPFMFKMANETFYELKKWREGDRKTPAPKDILRMMLPSVCYFIVEKEARNIIFETKQNEILLEYMEFYFNIAYYKRLPIPRAERLKRMNEPDPTPTYRQLADMAEARAVLISLCNVLINLTVLVPKMSEEDPMFVNLFKFVVEHLPELKDLPHNLVLHGNLAILGLLLLKQQAMKVKHNDFSICRYIQATVRFLWDAYNIDESNDPSALVVSITYKEFWSELSEIWFLGMQTIGAILPMIPWLSEFIIESGWAEGIIRTLNRVRPDAVPSNIKAVYEDFLSQLVEVNSTVSGVLKKADALRACRTHRLMELGKRLFGD